MKKFLLLITISILSYSSMMAQSASITSTNVSCFGGNDGTINIINATGGTAPYEYSIDGKITWFPGGFFSNLNQGMYNVWIRDVLFSEVQLNPSYLISEPPPLSASVVTNNVSCFGSNNGSIEIININGGMPSYSFSIDGGITWYGSPVFPNLNSGAYQVLIRDINYCQIILGNYNINSASQIISTGEIVSESCSNQATGTINLSNVSGGTPPYNYSWSNAMNGPDLNYLEYLNSGPYNVTITDFNGCNITRNFNVNQLAPFSINVNAYNVSCAGLNNGTASANVTGGNPDYLYYWGPDQYEQIMDSLAPGSYSVYVTDANGYGCTFSANYSIYEPTAIQINKNVNNVSCFGQNNGSVDLNVYGGNMPYTFMWSSGATTEDVYNLAYGKYYFTVTDYNNCTKIDSVEIFNASALTINFNPHNPICSNSNNGWIESFVSGGGAPYYYSWSNGSNGSSTLYNLSAGNYTLTVTDSYGCTAFNSVNLYAPPSVSFSIYSTNSTCGQSDGSAWVIVSGGTNNHTFSWSNSSTNDTINNLSSGLYNVNVTDTSGCSASQSISVNDVGGPVATNSHHVNVSCNGGNNGAAAVSVTGGAPPYTYFWMPWGYTNDTIINLSAGVYSVSVTDINGCRGIIQTEITQPEILNADLLKRDVSCNGLNDGGIMVSNVQGGTPPYSYLWSTGATVDSLPGLAQGLYQVTITDYNNCFIVKSDSIINPPVLQLTLSTSNTCPGTNNGSVFTNVTGGTPSYNYNWNYYAYSGNSNLTYLNAGTYTVTVTDQHGCIKIDSAVVNSFPQMDTSIQIINPICNGQSNGAINLEVTGGTAPFTYSWNNYPNNFSTQDINNIPAGYYYLTITDASSCNFYGSVSIAEPAKITLNPYVVNVSSCGLNDGIASVYVQNGIPPFTYNWGIYGVNDTVYNVGFGTYNVTVTDINGCYSTSSVIINEPASFYLNPVSFQTKCFGSSDGSAKVTAIGGSQPFTFLWSNASTSDSVSNLSAGLYYVTVSDALGCNIINEILITQPSLLQFSNINKYNVSCNGLSDGSISLYSSGGTCCNTIDWSHDTLLNGTSAYGLLAGNYTITITDANACFIDTTIIITQPPPLVIDSVNVLNISCANFSNGQIKIFAHGGTGSLNYTINDYNYNPTNEVTNLYAGNYTVRVKDNNNCLSSVQNVTLTQPSSFVYGIGSQAVTCNGGSDGYAMETIYSGGTPPYSFLWSNGSTNDTITVLVAGNYSVTVTDANGCILTDATTITEPPSPVIANAGTDISICQGETANLYANGGMNYLWNTSETSYSIAVSPTITTTYSVIVSDANGCTGSDTVIVNVNALPTSNAGTDQLVCANNPVVSLNGTITGATGGVWASGGTGTFSNSNNVITTYTPSGSDISAGNVTLTLSTTGSGVCSSVSDDLIVTISPFPTANAGADLTLCIGQSATLTATGGNTYSWSNGANTASTTVSPSVTTTYTVTVTNANGCMNTDVVIVTINTLPVANAGSNQVICSGTNLNLNASGGNTYIWSGPNGFTSSLQNPSINNISLSNAGTYNVTVTNSSTGCWATASTVITVNSTSTVPSSISDSGNPICIGSSTMLSVVGGSLGTGANWVWYSGACGGTFEGNGTTITVSPVSNKIYYVRAEGTCNSTSCGPSKLVYVDIPPSANAGTDAVVCDTTGYPLSASFGGNVTWAVWTTSGTGVFDDSYSPTAVYTPSASDVLSGTVTLSFTTDDSPDACPGTASDNMILTINQGVTVNAGTDQTTCVNNPNISLSGNVTNAIGGIWSSSGTGSFSPVNTSLNASYIPSAGDLSIGIVTLTLTSTGNGICAPANDILVIGFNPIPTSSIAINNVSCNGDNNGSADLTVTGGTLPYTYNWSNLAVTQNITGLSAGTYSVTITDVNGCQANSNATVTEPLALTAVIIDYANESCTGLNDGAAVVNGVGGTGNYTYLWSNAVTDSANYMIAIGNYSVTVTDVNACQAIETITINSAVPFTANLTSTNPSCFGSSNGSVSVSTSGGIGLNNYYWNDSLNASLVSTLSGLAPGNYSVTVIEDGNMCQAADSIIITDPALITGTDAATICDGSIFILGTQTLTISGVYNETFIAANGCDSVVTLTLTVNPASNGTDAATICDGSTFIFGTQTLTISGVYNETFIAANGCDSVVTLTLTVNPASNGTDAATICDGSTFIFGTQTLTVSGVYNETFIAANGCDSVVTLTLTVNPTSTGTDAATICDGSTFTFGTQTLTTSGVYNETFIAANGCDSVVTLTLTVNPASSGTDAATICDGGTLTFGTQTLTTSGVYNETFIAANGCDSVVTLTLTVNPASTGTDAATICDGSTFTFGTQTLTTSGVYNETFIAANGCDSVVTLTLTVNPASTGTDAATICDGSTFTFGTQTLTTSGVYNETFIAANGCDSVVTLTLTVNPASTGTDAAAICDGGTFTFGTQTLTTSGVYNETFIAANGCDSVVTLTLTVNPTYYDTINAAICQGDSYTMPDNSVVTTAGLYPFNNLTSLGCDSNLVVNLSVNPLPNISFTGLATNYCFVDTFILLMGNYSTDGYFSGDGIVGGNVFNPINALVGNNNISYSYTDNNGCTNTYIQATTVNANPELTSTISDANCGQNNGSATLNAIGGIPPYTYSTGSNTLNNLSAGVIVVTVTDVNLCSASGYVAISNIGSPVVSVISQTDASCSVSCDGTAILDVTGGAEPYSFAWSNNETAQNPISLCPGESFVEVTDALGCITSSLITLNFNLPDPTIFGRITYSGGGIDGQFAKLEIYSTSQHIGGGFDLMDADVQIGSDGSFIMANFPPDIYILKVLLQGNNPAYVNLMNSYYTDTLTSFIWETADSIVLGCGNYKEANIIMHEMLSVGTGSGSLSGSISYPGAGGSKNIKGVYITEGKLAGEPVPGAEIFVELEPDDEPIANTTTDTAGFYAFEELPQGNYSLKVEIPGFPMVSTYLVAITPTDSVYDQLNFFVDTTTNSGNIDTTLVFVPNEEIPAFAVSVYPNPYKDYLNINYKITKTREVSIEIFDIKGSKIEIVNNGKQAEGDYNLRFDPKKHSLMPGTYFIQLRVDNSVYLKKVIMIE